MNQYIVDMYAKIETEQLQYLRGNQTRLRTEIYTDLQDAMQADRNLDQIGQSDFTIFICWWSALHVAT